MGNQMVGATYHGGSIADAQFFDEPAIAQPTSLEIRNGFRRNDGVGIGRTKRPFPAIRNRQPEGFAAGGSNALAKRETPGTIQ